MSLPSKGIPEKGITEYGAKVYNRQQKVIRRVKDAIGCARSFKVNSDRLWEMIQEAIRSQRPLPPYERGYVDGLAWTLREEVWQRDVRWQLYLDGQRVTSDEISKIADAAPHDRSVTWGRVMGRFEWISDPDRAFTELAKP